MTKLLVSAVVASAMLMAPAALAGQPAFVQAWHNTGDGHQANNNPGDTASDRHNFNDDTAGNSNRNPTAGSAQAD